MKKRYNRRRNESKLVQFERNMYYIFDIPVNCFREYIRSDVLEFIYRRFKDDCNWTSGNCYYFAKILKARFPEAKIYYDVINGHFLCKIGKYFYDYNGININRDKKVRWSLFWFYDRLLYHRIIRDVIK